MANTAVKWTTMRDGQVARLNEINAFVTQRQSEEVKTISSSESQVYIEELLEIKNEFKAYHEKLIEKSKEDEIPAHQTIYNNFFKTHSTLYALFISASRQQSQTGSSSKTIANANQSIQLPRMDLPKFTGDYVQWPSFHDLFYASIDQQPLTPAQKLQYLKSSLQGEPLQLISSLQIEDANYKAAWTLLEQRYQNKRIIVLAHMKALFNLPYMKAESSTQLRKLIDTTQQSIRSLQNLSLPTEHWDVFLVYILTDRLDADTRRQWELSLTTSECPTLKELTTFIEKRCQALENVTSTYKTSSSFSTSTQQRSNSNQPNFHSNKSKLVHTTLTNYTCPLCKENHFLQKCSKFMDLSINDKYKTVKNLKLCTNCLRGNHYNSDCHSGNCRICSKRHHTSLHDNERNKNTYATTINNSTSSSIPTINSHFVNERNAPQQILLATALIQVQNAKGHLQLCTALLDSASQATFISEKCAQKLGLKRQLTKVNISGIGGSEGTNAKGMLNICISSRTSNFTQRINAIILDKVTDKLPTYSFNTKHWEFIKGLKLADPDFQSRKAIDILLGGDIYPYLNIHNQKFGPNGSPVAQNTSLGWILSGPIKQSKYISNAIKAHTTTVDDILCKFWEIEEVPETTHLTQDEQYCEQHFTDTFQRDSDGRYTIELPFKLNHSALGDSKYNAIKRFYQLERKFEKQPALKEKYVKFMQEYISLNHMELVPHHMQNAPNHSSFYIPHHAVLKESSTTTKLRVVFDGSAKSNSGVSLNDTQLVGPTLQDNLLSILLRFRIYKIAFTADIEKMYRQFNIQEKHRDYQRILWREDKSKPMQEYRLCTVTYGTSSAPYLAVRSLRQLAMDESTNYPLASQATLKDFYVDDLMSGAHTVEDALSIQKQLKSLMKSGGLQLRKWTSNAPELLQAVPNDEREIQLPLTIETDESVKTLGICWHPAGDYFTYKVNANSTATITKRSILSEISCIYDPVGWLSPVVINAKILLQELWKNNIDWDDSLNSSLENKWNNLRNQLALLQQLKIPRYIHSIQHFRGSQLHAFCDSSEVAYGAVIYLKTVLENGETFIHLLCSKSRVAPMKKQTIPRLELCGALLLAKLLHAVKSSINFNLDTYAWSDSTIVLSWISSCPSTFKTFVANRITQIKELIPTTKWYHVKSKDNPADLVSRGISPEQILNSTLWWSGPPWLKEESPWTHSIQIEQEKLPEIRVIKSHLTTTNDHWFPFDRFSSLPKMVNTTVYIHRFIFNCKNEAKRKGAITYIEANNALLTLIKQAQQSTFTPEIQALISKKPLKTSSILLSLTPFVDDKEILRVGGRLKHANISYDKKHPILLPPKHILTKLIIEHEHKKQLHAGPSLLLATLQNKYWIVNGRNTIRHIIHKCIVCFKQRPKPAQQIMANLPICRLETTRPFLQTGVDLAGPFKIKHGIRGQVSTKCYISLFICMTVKAIHLELVSSLSTEAFIAALRRFVSRRGKCSHLYSDQGTNFIGAEAELKKQYSQALKSHQFQEFLTNEGITWTFNPPGAPHFGGLWEAGVKSTKYHLRRIIGSTPLTYEELSTTITQIEACLNSRPLTPLSNDPDDLQALTPGHFLIGAPLTAIPEPDLTTLKINTLSRWQLIQTLVQHFWKRWQREYLARLQQRPKWVNKTNNLTNDTLVLILEENIPPSKWKLARIISTHPGSDGSVRVATVKTSSGIFKRPIAKLCPLPLESNTAS